MTGKPTCLNGSREPAMLSDSDIVTNTKSTGASIRELQNADLNVVTGGTFVENHHRPPPGGGFPIGVIYRP